MDESTVWTIAIRDRKRGSISRFSALALCLCLSGLAVPVSAQEAEIPETGKSATANDRYEYRDDHDPNGTGKFYMGREIALVMGHFAIGWLERPEREVEEAPKALLDSLKIQPGDVVADIGAGSGYFSFRMAKLVGDEGKVLAVDIQPEMLDAMRRKMKKEGIKNVELIQGEISDPKLPPESVDLILMVDVYHEFSHPWEMVEAMVTALKPNGRIVFVEYRLEDPEVPIKLVHKMSQKQVIKEMEPHPLRWVGTLEVLPRQHIVIFEKSKAKEEASNWKRQYGGGYNSAATITAPANRAR